MDNLSAPPPQPRHTRVLMLGIAALAVLGIWLFIHEFFGERRAATVPRQVQINYKPVDFKSDIDPDGALQVMSNPARDHKAFNRLVFDLNTQLLTHVANRMGLDEATRAAALKLYDKHHPYLAQLYFNDFMALRDTTDALYATWYANDAANSVDLLNEIASKYTCFFINQILSSILTTENGRLNVQGKQVATPCGVALTEALRPTISRLQKRARIEDFSRSRGMMQEKVTEAIAELATVEVRDKKGISKQLQTKIWGYQVSSTNIEISAISIAKVGFKLDKNFNLELRGNKLIATLPPPQILSHEVYPKIDKLDQGWLRELSSEDFNKNMNTLRTYFREDVLKSDAMEQAKVRAESIMQTLMAPALSRLRGVTLEVRFAKPQTVNLEG